MKQKELFDFDGETYNPGKDRVRLSSQMMRVFDVVKSGQWLTLAEISAQADAPEASVSARLRDLRKDTFGGHDVQRERVGGTGGTFKYRLIVNKNVETTGDEKGASSAENWGLLV